MSLTTSEREEVRPAAPSRDRRLHRRALIALVAVAALVAAFVVLDPSDASPPATSDAGPHLGHSSRTDPETAEDLSAAGYVEVPGPEIMWEHRPDDAPAPSVDAAELEREVRAVVAANGWERMEAGERDGFLHLSDASDPEHHFNRANLDDDAFVDPERPESLVYDQDTGELLAVMFLMPIDDHGPGLIGEDAAWHVHATGMCFGADEMMPTSLPAEPSCPAGERYHPWSSEMLHVWFVGETFAAKMHSS